MKRKLLICSSLITLLLSVFSVPIFAEETVQDSSNLHSLSDGVYLDSYFYDNYDLLPYIESTTNQYINSGVLASSDLKIDITFSDIAGTGYLFGSRTNTSENLLAIYSVRSSDSFFRFYYYSGYNAYFKEVFAYSLYNACMDRNLFYFNNELVNQSQLNEFESSYPIYIFASNNSGTPANYGIYKLYKLSIYDYSANDGEGAYVRYYYPAKSKSGGIIGLYDAVNKTFISSASNTQFSNPTNDYVENFQISSFLSASLGWIGQIFTAIIDMPVIIIFMAIGLAGAMFRWSRRIVRF